MAKNRKCQVKKMKIYELVLVQEATRKFCYNGVGTQFLRYKCRPFCAI